MSSDEALSKCISSCWAISTPDAEKLEAMRVIRHPRNEPPEDLPVAMKSLIVPIAYDPEAFGRYSNGVAGRCSFCPEQAETMTPRVKVERDKVQRWLAFCQEHDRRRRWVKESRSGTWWYLPPPKSNEREHWWKLVYSLTGRVGGTTGWYLLKVTGDATMDLCTRKLHRARALVERYFMVRASGCAAVAAPNIDR